MSDHTDLIAYLDAANLGPVASAEYRAGIGAWFVELAPSGHLGATAMRWLDFVDLIDATAGRRRASDKDVHLNLRGQLPGDGSLVIVVIPFTDPRQVALIDEQIERQQLDDLAARLATLDKPTGGAQ